MSGELERLKSDLEVLDRYQGYSIVENARADLVSKIARLEAEADPWLDAKERIEKYRTSTDVATRRQVAFVDHLTAENDRLKAEADPCRNIVRRLADNEEMRADEWVRLIVDAKELWAKMQREAGK